MKPVLLIITLIKIIFSKDNMIATRLLQNKQNNSESIKYINLAICSTLPDCFKCNTYRDNNLNCSWRGSKCVVDKKSGYILYNIAIFLIMMNGPYLIPAYQIQLRLDL